MSSPVHRRSTTSFSSRRSTSFRQLYARILIPPAVLAKLKHPMAPKPVRDWTDNAPEADISRARVDRSEHGMVKWRSGIRARHSPTFPTMELLDQAPQAFLEELVERDRQVPNALPSGVENCICDGRRRPGDSDFANSARAQRRMFVRYTGVNDVDVRNIHIDRNMILGERWIHDSTPALVEEGFFSQRHADSHDDPAAQLAGSGFWIHHRSAIERAEPSRHAHFARFLLD